MKIMVEDKLKDYLNNKLITTLTVKKVVSSPC